ncbi:MAG: flagellar biosynthesis protein FlhF [Planctomycetia bacterium]
MELKTYRAANMQEALMLVRHDLGPEASVLHTREVRTGRLFGLLPGRRQIEVTASLSVQVPSRLPASIQTPPKPEPETPLRPTFHNPGPIAPLPPKPPGLTDAIDSQLSNLQHMVQNLSREPGVSPCRDLPDTLFHLFTELIDADVNEKLAQEIIDQVRHETPYDEMRDPMMVRARVARMIERDIEVSGPIQVTPGKHRVVALVGPTGVGKTTTIAKLAANYRLRKRHNVGLITVDTYRIAAVEQLRTYADIIDLPMQVVSTPREMRDAVRRLSGLDLILMDTAGRSPRDEIKIQELKAFLSEAEADEVHLVLSGVAGHRTLEQTADRFAAVGTTSMILTKLDEATGLGNLLPLLRSKKLPLSYLTNGQNVPDDIATAEPAALTQMILEPESSGAF